MGLVPIESMACGTPVLTYGRQGPASTVVNGVTGWLVDTPGQMIAKALEIWHRGESGLSSDACVRQSRLFSSRRMVEELVDWIKEACPVKPARRETLSPPFLSGPMSGAPPDAELVSTGA